MQAWSQWADVFITIAAVVGGIAVILRFAGKYVVNPMQEREVRRIERMLDEHLEPISNEVNQIAREVRFDGGESLKDAVHRLERGQLRIQGRLGLVPEDYTLLDDRLEQHADDGGTQT